MRKNVLIFLFTAIASATMVSADIFDNKLYITLSGAAGYYLLPSQIEGNVADLYDAYPNYYFGDAASYTGYSNDNSAYRHPFAPETDVNLGYKLQAAYFIIPQFAVGFEYGHSFSVGEYQANHTIRDTIQDGYYSYEYTVYTSETKDRLYLKHSTIGFMGMYRFPWKGKMDLDLGLGMGMADYLQVFKIKNSMTERNYTSSWTLYDEQHYSTDFNTYGIKYHAFYLKPQVALRYRITDRLAFKSSFSIPLSFIEKGSMWNENGNYYSEGDFYPDARFMAGNLSVDTGLELSY